MGGLLPTSLEAAAAAQDCARYDEQCMNRRSLSKPASSLLAGLHVGAVVMTATGSESAQHVMPDAMSLRKDSDCVCDLSKATELQQLRWRC